MDPKLVYDVGVHRGEETAYYLHKGFRVVGVEASPAMADHLRNRFRLEIASGALQLLEVGVAEFEGELDFWVCDAVSEWSSFMEKKARIVRQDRSPVEGAHAALRADPGQAWRAVLLQDRHRAKGITCASKGSMPRTSRNTSPSRCR